MIDEEMTYNRPKCYETPEEASPKLKQDVNDAYYGKRIAEELHGIDQELHDLNKIMKKIMLGIGGLRR